MSRPFTRRTLLALTAGSATAAALPANAATADPATLPDVGALDDKIRDAMARYRIPGVSLGLWSRGVSYVRGYGVTNVNDPTPVTGDTVFRIGSTTKTFTGTAIMRLVERNRINLDRTVHSYLPGFRTADQAASRRVTVRQALNHTAGWLGDFFLDTGPADDALARYVTAMAELPQLTPPGSTFAYNNAALSLAGRLIEVVAGESYEHAVRRLVIDPLRLTHSAFFLNEIPNASVAEGHGYDENGQPVPVPEYFALPRSLHPAGGLISSARDQLRWARLHLGNGDGLLTPRSLRSMQSHPGPGGTLFVELDGVGVTWMIRPTAEGPKVIQHGGDWSGQHSGFLMVPARDFALTVLTNSETGPALIAELFADDWPLRRFAGVRNLPAPPRPQPAAAYEGAYTAQQIDLDGTIYTTTFDLTAAAGGLTVRFGDEEAALLSFYRKDYVLVLAPDGTDSHTRANFVRDHSGKVTWLRMGGRLYRRGTTATARIQAPTRLPALATLPHP
jgi:CubicO group peptidase (beta-lactamase class C family)